MFGNNLVFWWCCALLLVASSSKHQRNFTNNNKKHDISKLQYKIDEISIKNFDNEKKRNISTIKFNVTDCNEDSNECLLPHAICILDTCYPACCHLEDHLSECIPGENRIAQAFADGQYSLQSKNQEINLTVFALLYDPCEKIKEFYIFKYPDFNKNVLITNGTVYFPYHAKFVESKSFCLMGDNMLRTGCNITMFNINFPTEIVLRILIYKMYSPDSPLKSILYYYKSIRISLRIFSILFLLTIFLVYSILPQLRNKHGFILCNCIGAMIVAYIFESTDYLPNTIYLGKFIKFTIVSVCYFGFLATNFWLTVMNFDMWWTFRDISSLLANMRNRQQERERKKKERKKLIMYSVCAWGISVILTIVYVIMNPFPFLRLPSYRPEFSIILIWLTDYIEIGLYYYIPSTICSVSSICLFFSTLLKIRRYKKNTTHHLRNVDSRVYDEYKKWSCCMYAFAREQTADEVSKGFCSQLNASALPIFERKNFLLKERCTKNGGPGAFENVQRAEMDMKQCLQSPINITNVRAEIKKYKSIGNLVVTFKNYCNERFIKRSCSDNYTDAMKHYSTKTGELEKERL